MRPLLTAVLIVAPSLAFAGGDPCSKGTVSTDPMSGAVSTSFANGYPGGFADSANGYTLASVALNITPKSTSFHFEFKYPAIVDTVLPAGVALSFRLDDGSVVSLSSSQQAVPAGHALTSAVWSSYSMDAPVSPEFVQSVVGRDVTAVGLAAPQGPQAWAIKGGGQKRFATAFACLTTLKL